MIPVSYTQAIYRHLAAQPGTAEVVQEWYDAEDDPEQRVAGYAAAIMEDLQADLRSGNAQDHPDLRLIDVLVRMGLARVSYRQVAERLLERFAPPGAAPAPRRPVVSILTSDVHHFLRDQPGTLETTRRLLAEEGDPAQRVRRLACALCEGLTDALCDKAEPGDARAALRNQIIADAVSDGVNWGHIARAVLRRAAREALPADRWGGVRTGQDWLPVRLRPSAN